jgi:hypothetical protein
MSSNTSKALRGGRVLALLGLTAALLSTSGGTLTANGSGSHDRPAGTWLVQVTVRDCTTNAPLGPAFNSLVTLHEGGTISESAGGAAFRPGQRSPGHGTWTPRTRRTIAQRMVALINFDTPANLPGTPGFDPSLPVSPGFFAGWQTVTHTIRFSDADHFASAGTNAFYKASGEVYRTGCSTAVGERFE